MLCTMPFSSPTMARCSAAKATGNPQTNFMAPGEPDDCLWEVNGAGRLDGFGGGV